LLILQLENVNYPALKIHYNSLSEKIDKPVVTVGFFDGVHRGHQLLLNQLKCRAAEISGHSVVVTLWPHPRMVLGKANADFRFLTSLEEKLYLLEKSGIDHTIVLPFNQAFASLSAGEFISQVLVNSIGAKYLIMGYDNYFGHDRQGNYDIIRNLATPYNLEVEKFKEFASEDGKVSSSAIRHALAAGNTEKAANLLGRYYSLQGKVVMGNQIGRTIGFPTANIDLFEPLKLVPLEGVFAAMVHVGDRFYKSMLNIGYRPTLGEEKPKRTIEAHLFDFDGNLYDTTIMVNFVARLRNEQKFNGLDALKAQLKLDMDNARNILSNINCNELL
jgi:riboflavin kinase / FMN adenylyltransferase